MSWQSSLSDALRAMDALRARYSLRALGPVGTLKGAPGISLTPSCRAKHRLLALANILASFPFFTPRRVGKD
jgi:hypothetical protein